jgi:hypothetical protein
MVSRGYVIFITLNFQMTASIDLQGSSSSNNHLVGLGFWALTYLFAFTDYDKQALSENR